MKILPVKDPQEQYIHTVSFENLVGTAAVTYANATVVLLKGPVDDTANIVLTTLTSDGAVNLTIRQGTDEQNYLIRTLISDANNNIFEEDLVLMVRETLT